MSRLLLAKQKNRFDLVVYGATLAGVIYAWRARLRGKSVCIVEPTPWIGGVIAGGLCWTDTPGGGNPGVSRASALVGGLTKQFYADLHNDWSGSPDPYYTAPPYRMMRHFWKKLNSLGVTLIVNSPIEGEDMAKMGVGTHGQPVVEGIKTRIGWVFASQFHDASYEFDLGAAAGIPYLVGRESVDTYDERDLGNRIYAGFKPSGPQQTGYVDRNSSVVFAASAIDGMVAGQADQRIMAYNFRCVVTRTAGARIAFTAPPTYDRTNYKIAMQSNCISGYATFIDAVGDQGTVTSDSISRYQTNSGGFQSMNLAGINWDYPDATWAERQVIKDYIAHWNWGYFYFLQNHVAQYAIDLGLSAPDQALCAAVQADAAQYGFINDEHQDSPYTPGFPHALYIRQSRLPHGKYKMTLHDMHDPTTGYPGGPGTPSWPDDDNLKATSVCVWNYALDTKAVWYYQTGANGIRAEGYFPFDTYSYIDDFEMPAEVTMSADGVVANLTFSTCHSSSSVAWAVTRLELNMAMLAEAAAEIQCMSIDSGLPVQDYDYATLAARLLEHGSVLH